MRPFVQDLELELGCGRWWRLCGGSVSLPKVVPEQRIAI